MGYTLPRFIAMLVKNSILWSPEFWEDREVMNYAKPLRCPKPVVKYPDGKIKLGYNISTRTNGVDKPRWPEDLMTPVVT